MDISLPVVDDLKVLSLDEPDTCLLVTKLVHLVLVHLLAINDLVHSFVIVAKIDELFVFVQTALVASTIWS